jgi:hypothetical protein
MTAGADRLGRRANRSRRPSGLSFAGRTSVPGNTIPAIFSYAEVFFISQHPRQFIFLMPGIRFPSFDNNYHFLLGFTYGTVKGTGMQKGRAFYGAALFGSLDFVAGCRRISGSVVRFRSASLP